MSDTQSANANMSPHLEDPDTYTGTGFRPDVRQPGFLRLYPERRYIFGTGYLGSGEEGGRVKRFRVEENAADRIEMEMAFDMKVVCSDLGMLFTNVHD